MFLSDLSILGHLLSAISSLMYHLCVLFCSIQLASMRGVYLWWVDWNDEITFNDLRHFTYKHIFAGVNCGLTSQAWTEYESSLINL